MKIRPSICTLVAALSPTFVVLHPFAQAQEPTPVIAEVVEETEGTSTEGTSQETQPSQPSAQATEVVAKEIASDDLQFIRLTREESEPASLETCIIRYASDEPGGAVVDLIGAVHIGEQSYYERLNEQFDKYDVLLYELVAPEGTVIPRGGARSEGFNPVAFLQDSAKNMLGLESQLEQIDYTKEHFIRADLTPTQIGEKMAERGDTALTLALDTLADVMREQNRQLLKQARSGEKSPLTEITLGDMLGNPVKMKRVMAEEFARTGSLDQAMGRSLNQLLIVDRNAQALKVLQQQLAKGKKRIGIFYGAAHLPDFDQHLREDFGLQRSTQEWIAAWDLKSSSRNKSNEPVNLLLNLLKAIE